MHREELKKMKKAQFFLAALLVIMMLSVVGCGTADTWPDGTDNGNNGAGTGDGIMDGGNGYNNNGYNNNGYNYTTNNGITNNNNR